MASGATKDFDAHHLHLNKGEIGNYVLLPGDPGRSELIARAFDSPKFVQSNREFETWNCYLDDDLITVISTGIGCPSTAIALEEAAMLGAHTAIRVGTAGSMSDSVIPGDLAVITGAIRHEGTSPRYLPLEYPAIADFEVSSQLLSGMRNSDLPVNVHEGISLSKDSYYEQTDPDTFPLAGQIKSEWQTYKDVGILCTEMEASALYTIARVRGIRSGGVMLVGGHKDGSPMTEVERARFEMENLFAGIRSGMERLLKTDRNR